MMIKIRLSYDKNSMAYFLAESAYDRLLFVSHEFALRS